MVLLPPHLKPLVRIHPINEYRNSAFAKENRTARLLSSLLALAVVVLVSIPRLDAQTIKKPRAIQQEAPTAAGSGIQHIVWVWFENREASAITSVTAPYFTSFAAANVNLTNFYGVSHPSQPNYLDGFSGSNQGVTGDGYCTFPASTDNLAKQLAVAGKSWRVYAQNFPGSCSDTIASTGGVDGPGLAGQYVRKHNPVIAFESVRSDPVQCGYVQPLANFDPTANFVMVVPNMTNDMHDGTTAQGDAFLQAFVPLVTASPDWAHTLLIVTFDEGTTSINGGGHVYTAAAAPWLAPATVATTYNHYSVLRTIEEVYGLPFLGGAATATTITQLLPSTSTPTPTATASPPPTPSPTPPLTPSPTPTPPAPTPTITPGQCGYVFLSEDFDGVTAPALPTGWVSSFTPGPANCTPTGTCAFGTNWTTS
ncbi:MAG: phosphatidylinositol-3-phosphatase, partial [Verrucomicrobiota bacterium]